MGHSTASGRNNGATGGASTGSRSNQAERLQQEIDRNGHVEYRGYDIDGQVYGEGVYSVFYAGDDLMADSVRDAMRIIDEIVEEERRYRF